MILEPLLEAIGASGGIEIGDGHKLEFVYLATEFGHLMAFFGSRRMAILP